MKKSNCLALYSSLCNKEKDINELEREKRNRDREEKEKE